MSMCLPTVFSVFSNVCYSRRYCIALGINDCISRFLFRTMWPQTSFVEKVVFLYSAGHEIAPDTRANDHKCFKFATNGLEC